MSDNCIRCGLGRARTGPDLLCDQCREIGQLRILLAVNYAGIALYQDDGELQDNRMKPFIDFKRDSVIDIIDKMRQRGHAQLEEMARKQKETSL